MDTNGNELPVDLGHNVLVTCREQLSHVAQWGPGILQRRQQRLQTLGLGIGNVVLAVLHLGQDRQHRGHVVEHRHGAELGVERQGQLPLLHELVHRRVLRSLQHPVRDPVCLRSSDHIGIERILDDPPLRLHQLGFWRTRNLLNPVGVVEQHSQIANPADTGVEARRRLTTLQAWEAEDALLRLAR